MKERVSALIEYLGDWVQFYVYRAIKSKEFKKLEKYKDLYKGERCFLLGNGPSLKLEDIEKLKDEKTFALNAFVKALDEISYKPTFYGLVDGDCMDIFGDEIINSGIQNIFFTRKDLRKVNYKKLQNIGAYEFPQMHTGKWIYYAPKMPQGFSQDITRNVYWGYTVAYSMMQIINYMGFKEVYLLGMDCAYKPGVESFKDCRSKETIAQGTYIGKNGAVDKFIVAHETVKKFANLHDITVYNATRGGMLEVFERVDLDEVLKEK